MNKKGYGHAADGIASTPIRTTCSGSHSQWFSPMACLHPFLPAPPGGAPPWLWSAASSPHPCCPFTPGGCRRGEGASQTFMTVTRLALVPRRIFVLHLIWARQCVHLTGEMPQFCTPTGEDEPQHSRWPVAPSLPPQRAPITCHGAVHPARRGSVLAMAPWPRLQLSGRLRSRPLTWPPSGA